MAVQTAAGSKIYIGTTTAATNQTEFEADTYTEIGEVTNIPAFGSQFSEITFTGLGNRIVQKFKGSEDPGTLAIEFGYDPEDTGQQAVETALGSDDAYNFKVTLNDADTAASPPGDPTTFYFRARVMSARPNIGTVENVVMGEMGVGITTRPIKVAAT